MKKLQVRNRIIGKPKKPRYFDIYDIMNLRKITN
jgi:hypothetical protein